MSEWSQAVLSDFIKVKHGYAFKGEFITDQENDQILVTPGNFKIGGGFKSDKLKYFKDTPPEEYILSEGDIVVTMTDLSKESDTLGYSAKIPKSNEKIFLHNQRIGLVQFISDEVSKDFIYWLMRTKEYQWFIIGSASGTSVMHTSPSRILEYQFKIPDPDIQERIAQILTSLDDKIDLLHRQNKTLSQMTATLFRQEFVEEAREDWTTERLENILTISSSKRIFYKEYVEVGVPFYRSKEIIELSQGGKTKSELYITEERFNDIQNKFGAPSEGDILLTSVGTLGVSYRVRKGDRFYFKDGNLTWFKDFKRLSSAIMYCWLNSNIGKEALNSITIGSTQAALTLTGLRGIEIRIPPKEIQEKLDKDLEVIFSKQNLNLDQIRILESMRNTLLPKLMDGSIAVS